MIGKVIFAMGGAPAEAILGDDGRWTVRSGDDRTDHAGACKRLAAGLGVVGRVHFTGQQPHAAMPGA